MARFFHPGRPNLSAAEADPSPEGPFRFRLPARRRPTRRLLLDLLFSARRSLASAPIAAVLLTGLAVLVAVVACWNSPPPLLVRGLIDDALPAGQAAGSAAPLTPYLIGLVLLPLAAGLLGLAQQYLAAWISQRVLVDLRTRLFRHLQSQSLRFFTTTRAGEIASLISEDVGEIRWVVNDTLPETLGNLVLTAGTLAVLFWVSWPLALAACATLPLFLLPARRVGRWRRSWPRRRRAQHARMLGLVSDVLNAGGFLLMRLFGRGDEEARRFAEHNRVLLRQRLVLAMADWWMTAFFVVFGAVAPALVYWYGGTLVIQGKPASASSSLSWPGPDRPPPRPR